MFFRKQKTPTKNDGQELINKSNQQGQSVGDGTNERVITGYQKDGFGTGKDYGIKVSQDGVDVRTASDDQLVMSSAFNMFKIVGTGEVTIVKQANSTSANTSVGHGLSYRPEIFATVTLSSALGGYSINYPYIQMILASGDATKPGRITELTRILVDDNNIDFNYWTPDVTPGAGGTPYATEVTVTFRYYLLAETAPTA